MRSNTRGFIDVGITTSVLALLAIPLAFADAAGQCPPANSAWLPCRAPVGSEGISIRDATIIVSGTPSAPVFRYKSCLLNQSDHPVAVTAQVMIFSKDGRKLGSDGQDIGLIAPSRNPKEPGMPLTYPFSVDFSGLPVDARHNLSQGLFDLPRPFGAMPC